MLGRLSMTVDECIQAYENLADKVFGHPRRCHIRSVSTLCKFSSAPSSLNRVQVRRENARKSLATEIQHGNADTNIRSRL